MPTPAQPSTELVYDRRRLRVIARSLEASLCVDSLAFFFERAWRIVEPTRALLPSVANDAFCAAGQAVAEGRIRRLGVETCPGTGKSLFWSVIFPAWLLLRTHGAARVMAGSYAWSFAERDAMRCRDLVQSDWYRGLVEAIGDDWAIREDANKKGDWWTTVTGRRLITSVDGATIGQRCTWQLIDDPLSEADVHSTANKAEATRWCFEVMPSRLEDQRVDPRVMVMQRLDAADPMAAARTRGWTILSLPAVLGRWGVPEEGCVLLDDAGAEVWRDPRAPGEPIVELLDLPTLERLRVELGASVFAAKYLQRPGDDSAAVFRRTWWRFYRPAHVPVTAVPPAGCDELAPVVDLPEVFDRIVITADLSFGSAKGDFNAVQAWGARGPGRYLLARWHKRAGFEEALHAIERMARQFPTAKVLIEKAANGHAVIEQIRKLVPGVVALRPIGSKAQRDAAAAPTVESGCAYLPLGLPGLDEYVEEMAGATRHDDERDATSYALIELNSGRAGQPIGGMLGTAATSTGGEGWILGGLSGR